MDDPMLVLSQKGSNGASLKLVIRAAVYDTISICTGFPIHKINTYMLQMKSQRIVHITNISVNNYICRVIPNSYPVIYMTKVVQAEFLGVAGNQMYQEEVKQNPSQIKVVKSLPISPREGSPLINSVPLYQTSQEIPVPERTPLTPPSKIYSPYPPTS